MTKAAKPATKVAAKPKPGPKAKPTAKGDAKAKNAPKVKDVAKAKGTAKIKGVAKTKAEASKQVKGKKSVTKPAVGKQIKSAKQAKQKSLKAKKSVSKGVWTKRARKVRTSVHFHRPYVKHLPRNPKYTRKSVPTKPKLDEFSIIKNPLTTESAMKKIEDQNTLVFIVDKKANKPQVKTAIKELYKISVDNVNTMIRPDGQKKAYIRLASDYDALDVANKIGII